MLITDRIPFDLVRDQLSVNRFVQRFEFERIKIRYANLPDKTFLLQVQERTSGLPRIQKRILPMNQVQVNIIGLQSLQALSAGPQDTVICCIIVAERFSIDHRSGDPGLGDQFDPSADRRICSKCISHHALAECSSIDLGSIKCCDASVYASVHK